MDDGVYRIERGGGSVVSGLLDELTKLYAEVYAEPPYNSGPLFGLDSFTARTTRQASRPGFAISWARSSEGELIGFSFGLPFESGKWWAGNASPPPAEILEAPKFAVIELVVAGSWRGRGVGRELIGDLLGRRTEAFAILTADPDAPARRIYEHWGWEQVGTARHTDDAPLMDQLVLRR